MDNLDKSSNNEITLTESALILNQDAKQIIAKWLFFKKTIFKEKSIQLFGDDIYLFQKNLWIRMNINI